MGSLFKPTSTKTMPKNAEVFTRSGCMFAKWRDSRGTTHTDRVVTGKGGILRIQIECDVWYMRYTDADGVERRKSTGCRDKVAAAAVLAEQERRTEKEGSGILSRADVLACDFASIPLSVHAAEYVADLRTRRGRGAHLRINETHILNVEHSLNRVFDECGFRLLRDLDRAKIERWGLLQLKKAQKQDDDERKAMSPETVNRYFRTVTAFGGWLETTGRMQFNPVSRIRKMDVQEGKTHERRALSPDELRSLLRVARLRPLAETVRLTIKCAPKEGKGSRSGWCYVPLTLDTIEDFANEARKKLIKDEKPGRLAELELIGHRRAAMYRLACMTGLRKAEIASLTVGSFDLENGYVSLGAGDAKSGKSAELPLRKDLADDLGALFKRILEPRQNAAREKEAPFPASLPSDEKPFPVPADLIRVFNRDCEVAGISKSDDRGQIVDFHSMRKTFITLLQVGGVDPRTCMELARHSDIRLTTQTYCDVRLLNTGSALDVLPDLNTDKSVEFARGKLG